jgi:hypothetical protein
MIDLNIKWPDWSDHPPAPRLTMEEYEAWIIGEILPTLHAAGLMTDEALAKDFARNEGAMTEPFVYHED